MSKLCSIVLLGFAGVATIGLRAQAPGAGPRPMATSNDAVAALVEEVRALRVELSAVAGASVRSQLLVTRIQLQEQRLMHLDRQRVEVASKLRETEAARMMFGGQIKSLESPGSKTTAEQRRDAEEALGPMKTQLQAMRAAEATLRAEHDNVLNALSTEQSRWNDFNNRLDELERSLPARSR